MSENLFLSFNVSCIVYFAPKLFHLFDTIFKKKIRYKKCFFVAKENTNSLVLKEFLGSLVLHNRLTWDVGRGMRGAFKAY